MPPLTEVTEFDIRRNTSGQKHTQPSPGSRSSPLRVKKSQENIAIQGMLRLGTETGAINQLPTHTLGLAKPNSLASCRRTGSSESVFSNHPAWVQQIPLQPCDGSRRYGSRPRPSTPGLARPESARSVKTSYRNDRCPRVRGQRSYASGLEGFTNSNRVPYGFQTHRSLMALRGQGDPTSYQRQVHFPHSTYPRAPSFRTCSPAVSDTRGAVYPSVPTYDPSGSVDPATPTYLNHQCSHFHCADMNRSVSSLQQFPSPAMSSVCYPIRRSPFPSRSTTPIPAALNSSSISSPHSCEGFHPVYRSPKSSMAPTYYDYSESYMLGAYPGVGTNSSMVSLSTNGDQIVQEDEPPMYIRQAQTPFGLLPGSIFSPSELPAASDSLSHSALAKSPHATPPRASSMTASKRSEFDRTVIIKNKDGDTSSRADYSAKQQERKGCSALLPPRSTSRRAGVGMGPFFSSGARDSERLSARAQSLPRTDPDSKVSSHLESKIFQSLEAMQDNNKAFPKNPSAKRMWKSRSLGRSDIIELPDRHTPLPDTGHYLSRTSQAVGSRHRSSNEVNKADRLGIHCPTPERPISSQSSQMLFDKILGHKGYEAGPRPDQATQDLAKMRDNGSPAKKPVIASVPEGYVELEATNTRQNRMIPHASREYASRSSDHEKSTIESLLDKHIECLGLEVDKRESVETLFLEAPCSRKSTLSLDRGVRPTRISDRLDNIRRKGHVRSATEKFESYTNMTPEQNALVPLRLFHGTKKVLSVNQQSDTNASQENETTEEMHRERPSRSWMTLPSTSALPSEDLSSSGKQKSESNKSHEEATAAAATKDLESEIDLRAVADHFESFRKKPVETKDPSVKHLQEQDRVHKHESSDETKVPLRLKIKALSLPVSCLKPNLTDRNVLSLEGHAPQMPASTPTRDEETAASLQSTSTADSPVELPATVTRESVRLSLSSRRPHSKPKSSLDTNRKPSVKTPKSHKSSTSHAYPVPYIHPDSKYPRLAAPDLGPPLTSMSFDLSLHLDPDASLREQKSSFSEESQEKGLKNSLRKRLHDIGNRLNVSPKASTDPLLHDEQDKNTATNAHRTRKHGRYNSTQQNGLTVGMSDFAYRKRKLLERLKTWWKRQKLRLRGKKSTKDRQTHRRQLSTDNI